MLLGGILPSDEIELMEVEQNAPGEQHEILKDIIEGKKHPLSEYMNKESSRIACVKCPCDDFMLLALKTSEWAFS